MEMIINLSTLFSSNLQQILLKAFVVGLLTAVCAAVLGVPLVLKRYSMIGDGLSHMGFCALAIAAALGVAPENTMYITMPFTVIAAIVLLLLSESGKIKGDAVIAMLSHRRPDGFRISLRSKEKRFPVGPLARRFGGGGHDMAAGCTISSSPEKAEKMLLEVINEVWK